MMTTIKNICVLYRQNVPIQLPQKFSKRGGGASGAGSAFATSTFLVRFKALKRTCCTSGKNRGGGGVIVIVYFGDVNLRGSFYDLVLACIDKLVSLIIGLKKLQKVIPIYQIYSL